MEYKRIEREAKMGRIFQMKDIFNKFLYPKTKVKAVFDDLGRSLDKILVPMTGATSTSDGNSGLVPAPTSANVSQFLKGNGEWSGLPITNRSDVNVAGQFALDACEKNPSVDGSLAKQISELNTNSLSGEHPFRYLGVLKPKEMDAPSESSHITFSAIQDGGGGIVVGYIDGNYGAEIRFGHNKNAMIEYRRKYSGIWSDWVEIKA